MRFVSATLTLQKLPQKPTLCRARIEREQDSYPALKGLCSIIEVKDRRGREAPSIGLSSNLSLQDATALQLPALKISGTLCGNLQFELTEQGHSRAYFVLSEALAYDKDTVVCILVSHLASKTRGHS